MRKQGVLIISHGSSKKEWVQEVDDAVRAVRLPASVPVFSSFLEMVEGRLVQDGIDHLESQGVGEMIVVPLFISSGSTHMDEISWALGVKPEPSVETDLTPFRLSAKVKLGKPIDDDPVIANIVYEKLRPLSTDPERETLLLVGHGTDVPGFHERWRQGLSRLAERVRKLGGFAACESAMLLPDEASAKMEALQRRYPDDDPIVAPLFLSEGYFTGTVIPKRLAGKHYRYNGKALLPSPHISEWIERQIRHLLSSS